MSIPSLNGPFLAADWIITSAFDNVYGIRFDTVRWAESQATLNPKFRLLTFVSLVSCNEELAASHLHLFDFSPFSPFSPWIAFLSILGRDVLHSNVIIPFWSCCCSACWHKMHLISYVYIVRHVIWYDTRIVYTVVFCIVFLKSDQWDMISHRISEIDVWLFGLSMVNQKHHLRVLDMEHADQLIGFLWIFMVQGLTSPLPELRLRGLVLTCQMTLTS